jgi:hypothetical protein
MDIAVHLAIFNSLPTGVLSVPPSKTDRMSSHALITFSVSPSSLDLLDQQFDKVTYLPPSEDNRLPRILEALETAQVFLVTSGDLKTLPADEEALEKVGKGMRVVQLGSAGADAALKTDWVKGMVASGRMARNEGDWRGRDTGEEEGNDREHLPFEVLDSEANKKWKSV